MSPIPSLGFVALLVGIVLYGTKMAIEGEPVDVLTLIGMTFALGYIGGTL